MINKDAEKYYYFAVKSKWNYTHLWLSIMTNKKVDK